MKKLLMLILIALLIALSVFIVINGLNIGKIEILGYNGLKNRNDELDQKIQEATKLATVEYKSKIKELEKNVDSLEKAKKEYEDEANITGEADLQMASQFQQYNYERLLVDLGRHATSEGANLKIEVVGNGTEVILGTDKEEKNNKKIYLYDFNFTVTGSYVAITSFIADIENDQDLGFRIEQFKLKPGASTSDLESTFTCKNIPMIEKIPVIVTKDEENAENGENSEENSNNTNTENTNETNTNNTTNETDTDNSTNETNETDNEENRSDE